jgi:hypothetical protein
MSPFAFLGLPLSSSDVFVDELLCIFGVASIFIRGLFR